MGAGALIAVSALGTLANAGSQIASANSRAEAARRDSFFKELQADEILSRARINKKRIARDGESFKSEQIAAFAGSGVDISGSALLALEETNRRITEALFDADRESQFKADQLRRGADVSRDLASDIKSAGFFGALGTTLSGGANIGFAAGAFDKRGKAKGL